MSFIQSFTLRGSKGLNLARRLGLLGIMGAWGTALGGVCTDTTGGNMMKSQLKLASWFFLLWLTFYSVTAFSSNCPGFTGDAGGTYPLVTIGGVQGFQNNFCLATKMGETVVTTDVQNWQDINFAVGLPDNSPSGATYPTRTYMIVSGLSITQTTTCPGATITTGSNVNRVTLNDGGSCALTVRGNSGTNGGLIEYAATLSRSGNIYSLSTGTVIGHPFSGTVIIGPEIDIQRPVNTSIADAGTDAQGNKTAGDQITLTYTVKNTGNTVLNVTNITSTNSTNVSVDSIPTTAFTVTAGATTTFTVLYTPTAVGAFSFDLDISSDDADEGNYDITVSGGDSIPPGVEILDAPVSVANNDPFTISFEFSENVIDFTLGDITIGNGSVAGFVVLDSNTYTADITPDGNGDITIDVAASVARDEAGNNNTAATQVVVTYGHIILPPAEGSSSGQDVSYTFAATQADGVTPVAATLSIAASTSKLPAPPEAANSLVSAIDITSTSSVNGYILVVTFGIPASSTNQFVGFWKYGSESSGTEPDWYDYGTLTANGNGTGYEISADQKTLTIYLIDGVRGDNDLQVNASITDPALPIIQADPIVFKDGFESSKQPD